MPLFNHVLLRAGHFFMWLKFQFSQKLQVFSVGFWLSIFIILKLCVFATGVQLMNLVVRPHCEWLKAIVRLVDFLFRCHKFIL